MYLADGTPASTDGLHNGTWQGTARYTQGPTASLTDQAFSFNGDGSQVVTDPAVTRFQQSPFKVAFKVQTTGSGTMYAMGTRGGNCGNPAGGWFDINVSGGFVGAEVVGAEGGGGASNQLVAVNDGAWHDVALTRSGPDVLITVDGQSTAFSTGAVATISPPAPFVMGSSACAFTNGRTSMIGGIDEVSIGVALPVATSQPADAQVTSGATATFSTTTDDPAATVQWQRSADGVTFVDVPGATTLSYTTGPLTTADNGSSFRAVFTGLGGFSETRVALLSVAGLAPNVTTQPASQTVAVGQPVSFTAHASGDPAATVQWQRSSNAGPYTDIAGATQDTYTIPQTVVGDNNSSYQAVFTNGVGVPAVSTSASLSVTYAPILTGPNDQTVNDGQTATFTVQADANLGPVYQWQVSTDAGTTYSNVVGATTNTTQVVGTPADNGNLYRVVVSNPSGVSTSRAALLTVNFAPDVTTQPVSQTVAAGQSVSFTAHASGNPAVTVQWQHSSGGAPFADIVGATQDMYTTPPTAAGDNNSSYRAVFSNGVGTPAVSNVASLTVTYAPILTGPNDQTVNEGQTATFTVQADANPGPATYQWQVSTDAGTTYNDVVGATASALQVVGGPKNNRNLYRVIVSNPSGGSTSRAARLTVNLAPGVTTQPVSQTITDGQPVTFTAHTAGDPNSTVQWTVSTDAGVTFNDILGAVTDSYTHTAALSENGNRYVARFTNPAAPVFLPVRAPARFAGPSAVSFRLVANSTFAQAVNSGGVSFSSAATLTVNAVVAARAPGAVRNLIATQTGARQVTVTWDAPTDPGSSPITGYGVGFRQSGNLYPADTRSVVFNDVDPGTYQVMVTAENGSTASNGTAATASVTVVTPVVPPVVPPVAPAAAPTAGALPVTGAEIGTVGGLAAVLLTLGGLLTFGARRRRNGTV